MKRKQKNKVIKHLKDDIETFNEEAHEDRKLIKDLKKLKTPKKKKVARKVSNKKKMIKLGERENKIRDVMEEFKEGELTMGKSGKPVKKRKQAIAIALSEARKKRGRKKK